MSQGKRQRVRTIQGLKETNEALACGMCTVCWGKVLNGVNFRNVAIRPLESGFLFTLTC